MAMDGWTDVPTRYGVMTVHDAFLLECVHLRNDLSALAGGTNDTKNLLRGLAADLGTSVCGRLIRVYAYTSSVIHSGGDPLGNLAQLRADADFVRSVLHDLGIQTRSRARTTRSARTAQTVVPYRWPQQSAS